MATLAEIAAIKRKLGMTESANIDPMGSMSFADTAADQGPIGSYVSPGLVLQPDAVTAIPGAPPNQQPGPLATDGDVNAAYQALMQYMAQTDQDKGTYARMLQTNLDQARINRTKTVMGGHQSAADRGILNSGIALGRDADVNTQYDSLERGYTDNYTDALHTMDRNVTGLQTNYDNATIAASAKYTQQQAEAAAATIQAQQAAALQQQQMAEFMAMLTPPTPANDAPPNPLLAAAYSPPSALVAPPKKKLPVSGQTGAIKQVIHGGPQ